MTPGITEEPEPSTTPAPTETPGEDGTEETPEITGTPEATVTPEPTETPDGEETEEAPEVTGTPEPTVTPGVTEEPEPSATPAPTETPEDEKDNIFDRENEKDTRPDEYGDDLTDEEKASIAEENHTCNGISVSGISLPWYVQFRATSSDGYEFSNETGANIFKSYEFELWDLKNDAEYHVPDGEYISVTVPVKAGYEYTIEHLLDNGAMETIVPSVDGSTMVFSTHSFSPFGIAGSKTLVGEEIETDGYEDSTAAQTTVTPTASASASAGANTSSESTVTPAASDNESSGQNSGTQNEDSQSSDQDSADAAESVNTGDNTPIVPFVILAVAAVVIIGVIIYLRKRK